MKKWLDLLSEEAGALFEAAGYERELGKVTVSNRPDLCEYQCNGAMAAAKKYRKAPMAIAQDILAAWQDRSVFMSVEIAPPGFLNLKISGDYIAAYLDRMGKEERFGWETGGTVKKVILDYGGPNVAKPLHVGHLRSAVIGESMKHIMRYHGDDVTGDIHLGDWGLQMGLVITELRKRLPDLVYFDRNYSGEWPKEAPFTVSELEEIYPYASAKSKEDPAYYREALENTKALQDGDPGYRQLWKQIIAVSTDDMKKNYARLKVEFDLWNGESTVHDLIPEMAEELKKKGFAYESDGALIVDVARDDDTKQIPPCMILKSDGAALYTTTDLATIVDREEKFHPDEIVYITDKRQELHFEQVFRCAKKCGLAGENTVLKHIGFGTVNGKDGHALKTRDGGVMRLETLLDDINAAMLEKISTNPDIPPEEASATASTVALSAVKYGDLSNQPAKDYIFDLDKFTSFEGDTGPYILYTMVRIRSILRKYKEGRPQTSDISFGDMKLNSPLPSPEKDLMTGLAGMNTMLDEAYQDLAPNRICAFMYQICNEVNSFYHATRILSEQDEEKQQGYLALLYLCDRVLSCCTALLGFDVPDRM
ncbi:MAG: arginine--tRNA ligase [Lachnospiraceae bacterium]|nr:arginine--tRNA ligase [Lachnospiraceae bacterium]